LEQPKNTRPVIHRVGDKSPGTKTTTVLTCNRPPHQRAKFSQITPVHMKSVPDVQILCLMWNS